MKTKANERISRRDFLRVSTAAGTGLLIGIYLSACQDAPTATAPSPTLSPTDLPTRPPTEQPTPTSAPEPEIELQPNAFLKIDSQGRVTIIASKPDLGQGTRTALPMIVAEELEVDWTAIRLEQAPADRIYRDQSVGGSDSISGMYFWLRKAGAAARGLLIAAAARTWGVDVAACYAENGAVIHKPSGKRLGYGELAAMAAEMEVPQTEVKNPKDFRLIGTRVGRVDNPNIVDGSAIFGSDVRLPGMLYAVVARSPYPRGRVESFEDTQALTVPGVRQVVQIDRGIAVVAENTWQALKGREALQITWHQIRTEVPRSRGMELAARKHPDYFAKRHGGHARLASLVPAVMNQGEKVLDITYTIPHFAHVTMEPMNCVADVRGDTCLVWAPTQWPTEAQTVARAESGVLDINNVQVNVPLIGGGFGRRSETDFVSEAVQISRAVGAPVKLFWTREDDIQHDFFHPRSSIQVQAFRDRPTMPQLKVLPIDSPLQTGAWRAVANVDEAFARECFMDEYAEALGMDAVELRLEVYQDQRLKTVLEKAAAEAGWGTPLPEGWGRGIASFSTFDVTPVAQVVELSVDDKGKIRVHRVVCAVECGTVVNPRIVEEQMEGGIVFALSAALGNEITHQDGAVQQSNFHDFPILRMDEMPVVEVHIISSAGNPSGVGEMGVPPLAPAVANAVYAATGQRIRQLPIRIQ